MLNEYMLMKIDMLIAVGCKGDQNSMRKARQVSKAVDRRAKLSKPSCKTKGLNQIFKLEQNLREKNGPTNSLDFEQIADIYGDKNGLNLPKMAIKYRAVLDRCANHHVVPS